MLPSTPTVSVRVARFDDADTLVRIRTCAHGSVSRYDDAAQVSHLLRDPDGRVLLVCCDGAPAAWGFVRTDSFTTVLSDIHCPNPTPELLSTLVTAALRLASEWGCRSASWRIGAGDAGALRVAVDHGFHIAGVLAGDEATGALLLTARRFLDPAATLPPTRIEIVRLPGDLVAGSLDDLRGRLLTLARDQQVSALVLDGSAVEVMSPVSLGVLLAVARIVRERGGIVHVDRPSQQLARALRLVGVGAALERTP